MKSPSLVALIALLAACGGAAEAPVEGPSSDTALEAPEAPESVQQRPQTPAPQALPLEPAPAATPEPTPDPVPPVTSEPAPEPEPTPEPEPEPAPEPEPTPEQPLRFDCIDAASCASCSAEVAAEHPDLFDSGAAVCLLRECAADDECSDLGDGLVCRPYIDSAGRSVCRAPRLEQDAICPVNELLDAQPLSPCELDLACQPYGGALRCRPI